MKNKKLILKIIGILSVIGIIICTSVLIYNRNHTIISKNNVNKSNQNINNTIKIPEIKLEEKDKTSQEEQVVSSNDNNITNKSQNINSNDKDIKSTDNNSIQKPSSNSGTNKNVYFDSSIKSNVDSSNTLTTKTTNIDDEVISYFTELKEKLENPNFRESAKQNFIVIVDFLFYDGKIKGYTFNELSNKAKLQVLKLTLIIDSYIDKYFPNYKETIANSSNKFFTSIKEKVIEKYLVITTSICTNDIDTCNQAKSDFQDMKKSFSITWGLIKEIAKSGTTHLKEWYEIYSGK